MDDLKIAQALGAVEGPLRALVGEAEGQGRIAGAAAEAERIWQIGKVMAKEWENEPNGIGSIAAWTPSSFLAELRKRAVPGEATFPAAWQTGNGLEPQAGELPPAASVGSYGGPLPMTDAERAANPGPDHPYPGPAAEDPGFDGRPAYDPLVPPEPVKPFDNSGAEPDVQTSKL